MATTLAIAHVGVVEIPSEVSAKKSVRTFCFSGQVVWTEFTTTLGVLSRESEHLLAESQKNLQVL